MSHVLTAVGPFDVPDAVADEVNWIKIAGMCYLALISIDHLTAQIRCGIKQNLMKPVLEPTVTAVQSQKAVSPYFTSKQILPFGCVE